MSGEERDRIPKHGHKKEAKAMKGKHRGSTLSLIGVKKGKSGKTGKACMGQEQMSPKS